MELTDTQKEAVRGWVKEGCGLAEVQKRLAEEFGVSMTYMDVRFLTIDMGLEVRDRPSRQSVRLDAPQVPERPGGPGGGEANALSGEGGVSVDVDRVMRPGSVVSGSVTFSDGVSASWWLDQLGKLAVDAGRPGYSPSREDLESFQQELRRTLETRGF